MMSAFGHDCLYYDLDDVPLSFLAGKIPFCLRPEILEHSNHQENSCNGQKITFEQLKSKNVSTSNLLWWNAAIEIIELYEKYLLSNELVNDDDQYYCNCSLISQFGKSCQYDMNTDDTEQNWRQICNGIVDCDYGEDEPIELCSQMESNQCDPEKEFRCQNGMCIPISMAFRFDGTCLDRTDQQNDFVISRSPDSIFDLCTDYPSYECDSTNHGWKRFSCNNGQFIFYEDLTLKVSKEYQRCTNNRHLMYLKQLFSINDENECWKAMICLTGFDYLYSHINCSQQNLVRNVEKFCPDEYYFPSNSVVYSFVFFRYNKINLVKSINYSNPDYICYKNEHCQINNLTFSTISKNSFQCFLVNQTIVSWKNFYEYVVYQFSSCFNTFSSIGTNNPMSYRCNLSNTYISISRLKNKKKDCYFNEDENPNINLCSFKINDLFQCLSNSNECVRQSFLNDKEYDCLDGSDEYFRIRYDLSYDRTSEFSSSSKRSFDEIYRFGELCDNIVNRQIFSFNSSETDETDCEYWPYSCNSIYTNCDQIWNCPNGIDDIVCEKISYNTLIREALQCKSNEYYCIRLINNYSDLYVSCINTSRTGDGIIDCIGGTDEQFRSICSNKYPYDFKRRFLCANSTVCIRIDQVCDTIVHCPLGDDEHICPWLVQNNSSTFSCNSTLAHSVTRCDSSYQNYRYCRMREDLWFCDLDLTNAISQILDIPYELYPPHDQNIKSISMRSFDTNEMMISKRKTLSLIDTNKEHSLCNFGYLVRSSKTNKKFSCFCPHAYYGDYCQYQSEYLIVLLEINIAHSMNKSIVFRLILYLLNEDNVIISYEETLYNLETIGYQDGNVIYLMYERMTNLSLYQRTKSLFVRIDSYIIKQTNVQYISSWLFHVSFRFLPVNKLVVLLSLRNELFRIKNCKKRCGSHGKCMYYVNKRDLEYCWCEQGFIGDQCNVKSLCNSTSCAENSQCVILNKETKQIKCICPLGRSGDQCYIKYNSCENVKCQNNGTCLPINQQKLRFPCVCEDDYQGNYCEYDREYSYITIDTNITDLSVIPAIFVFTDNSQSEFSQINRVLYKNISLPTTLKISQQGKFGFVQIFHSWSNISYYVVVIQERLDETRHVNTSVIRRNRCMNVSELFNKTILSEYSYLKRLKLYHLPCQHNHDLRCFFDEYRICLCTLYHNSDCHFFNHKHGNCDYCKNDGLCLRRNSFEDQWTFICLCRECSYGSLCQFSPKNYFITLDMLIGTEIQTINISFNDQPIVVHLTLMFLIIILIFTLIFNTIGIIIFSNKKLQQVGCDLYLLSLTIVAEIGLILLFLRYLYTIIIRIYVVEDTSFIRVTCISLQYLIRLIPSLFDWLAVCISVERAYTVIKDVNFTKVIAMKTLKLSRWIILIVILFNSLTTLHRPFHLKLIDEPSFDNEPQGHPWCVLDFGQTSWNIYEKVINICYLIIPLIVNILSIVIFILKKTNFELTSVTRKNKASRYTIVTEQILKYKPLIIGTVTIIVLEIPRFVLTFTLACIKKNWQRYVYLTGYLLSFLPLAGIVFIYIIPSPKYKQPFKTILGKILRVLLCKKSEE